MATTFSDKLTPAQMLQAQQWIKAKKQATACPSCGHMNTFGLAEHLVAPPVFTGGGLTIGGTSYPHLMLTCGNCGLTLFYNAVVAGITK